MKTKPKAPWHPKLRPYQRQILEPKVAPTVRAGDRRDWEGEIRCMAVSGNYIMARRPGYAPFALSIREWLALKPWPPGVTPP